MKSITRITVSLGVTILVLILSACGAPGDQGAPQIPAPTQPPVDVSPTIAVPTPTQIGEYTSPLYGYSLKLPEGWSPSRSASKFIFAGELPFAGEAWVDTFRGPGQKDFMVIAAQGLTTGTSLEVWAQTVIGMVPDCKRPAADQTNTELGGEPAIVIVDGGCFGIDHYWIVLLHGGRGYQVAVAGNREEFLVVRESVWESFRFTP